MVPWGMGSILISSVLTPRLLAMWKVMAWASPGEGYQVTALELQMQGRAGPRGLIAYSERCWIRDLRGRCSIGTRDPGLITQELLCSRVLLKYKKGQRKLLTDFRRGTESAPLLVLARVLYTFSVGYYSKSKECLKVVKVLTDPLPQNTF